MLDLNITLLQTTLHWENPSANRIHINALLDNIEATDLIVLPEMFNTGFSMDSKKLAEEMDGSTIQWMLEQAKKRKAVITGSLIVKEGESYFNRLIWMRPNGTSEWYDKKHLFRMANEDTHFASGKSKLIVELKGWKICPLICYDLRFPVWSRNVEKFDLLLYVANWPEARISAWEKLIYARAIENQCYVAAVNRIGTDGKDIQYSGNSVFIDPKGELIWKAKDHKEEIKTLEISWDNLTAFRKKFPVALDADSFKLT
ncbi:MAG: amidohydrolase [Flavobacteriales bacterium]|nr:amidohydrolase [Flavobacteriales bacterium]